MINFLKRKYKASNNNFDNVFNDIILYNIMEQSRDKIFLIGKSICQASKRVWIIFMYQEEIYTLETFNYRFTKEQITSMIIDEIDRARAREGIKKTNKK